MVSDIGVVPVYRPGVSAHEWEVLCCSRHDDLVDLNNGDMHHLVMLQQPISVAQIHRKG